MVSSRQRQRCAQADATAQRQAGIKPSAGRARLSPDWINDQVGFACDQFASRYIARGAIEHRSAKLARAVSGLAAVPGARTKRSFAFGHGPEARCPVGTGRFEDDGASGKRRKRKRRQRQRGGQMQHEPNFCLMEIVELTQSDPIGSGPAVFSRRLARNLAAFDDRGGGQGVTAAASPMRSRRPARRCSRRAQAPRPFPYRAHTPR